MKVPVKHYGRRREINSEGIDIDWEGFGNNIRHAYYGAEVE